MSPITIIVILFIMNAITCILYGIDKWKAIHGAWRISEMALLTWAALGGSFGAFLGMHLFHHKTRHKKFCILVPLFMAMHLSLIAWFAANA